MARKPTETVQVNLRIKESERRKLEEAAKRNGVSLNAEMAARLQRTFEQGDLLSIHWLWEELQKGAEPLLGNVHELNKQADLRRATQTLVERIQPLLATRVISGSTGEAIRQAIDRIYALFGMMDAEAAQRFSRMRMPGGEK